MVKKEIQWKKAYTDEKGFTHIPIKVKGKKKFKCDDCGKKVREVFTINPCEILLRRELCRACYCKTPESLEQLLALWEGNDFVEQPKSYKCESENKELSTIFVYVCNKCGESLDIEIESEFAKIPFEGTWSCKCGEVIKIKWDGKELKL